MVTFSPRAGPAARLQPAQAVHLALVTETFPPEINGVAMTLGHVAEGLTARGHRVDVHRPRQRHESAHAPSPHGYVETRHPSLPIPGYTFLRFGLPVRSRLLQTWRAERPDLVHIATEGPLGYAALLAAGKLGIPVSSSFHTNFHQYSEHYGFAWLTRPVLAYLRHFHNRTRITLSPSPDLNAALTQDGFNDVRLLSRGVNTRVFSPVHRDVRLRARWGAGPDDLVVVHVSRLAAEKNYELLFRCFESIRSRDPHARFVMVSDGPLRKKLSRRYPWAHFTGFLDRADLARHYASGDLFLYPSLTETFGNVVLEAMASGLPVAAFNYAAAARYLRDGENGRLAPFAAADSFYAAALELAADPKGRRRLGAAARETAETIPWDAVIDGLERDLLSVAQPTLAPA